YDSLLAKLIVHADDLPLALRRAYRALCEFRLDGVASNLTFLQNLLRRPELADYAVTTAFVGAHVGELLTEQAHPRLHAQQGSSAGSDAHRAERQAPPGYVAVAAPNAGVLVAYQVAEGSPVAAGQTVAILEAMKMEFEVRARESGVVRQLLAQPGENFYEGDPLLYLEPMEVEVEAQASEEITDLDHIRADLAEVIERHAIGLDERRPQAVAKRHKIGMRTIRENVSDLLDDGSFIEYGALALAAQRRRHSHADLLALSPADGMVAGLGTVNAG